MEKLAGTLGFPIVMYWVAAMVPVREFVLTPSLHVRMAANGGATVDPSGVKVDLFERVLGEALEIHIGQRDIEDVASHQDCVRLSKGSRREVEVLVGTMVDGRIPYYAA